MSEAPPTTLDHEPPRTWPAWTAAGLAGLILLLGQPPMSGDPWFSSGYVMRKVALGLAIALLLLLAAWIPSRLQRPRGLAWLWLLAPLGIVALGLLTQAGTGPRDVVRHGVVWAGLALLPITLANAFEIPKAARMAWTVVLGVGTLLCVYAFADALHGGRLAASFGRPAVAGAVFGALLAPAWLLTRPRELAYGVTALLAAACIATDSRAAIVGAIFGALVAAAIAPPDAAQRRRMRLITVAVAAGTVVWFGLALNEAAPFPGNRRTVDVRMGLHRASLALIAERPLTGHGIGRYESEALRLRDVEEARLEPGRRPEHAHLDLLHVSTEGGVLAGLLLLLWLGVAFVTGVRRLDGAAPMRRQHIAAALGVLTALGVAGLADGVLIDPGPALLAALAVASLLTMTPIARHEEPQGLPGPVRIVVVFAALGALVGAFSLRADAHADHALQSYVNARVALRKALATGATDEEIKALNATLEERFEALDGAGAPFAPDSAKRFYQVGVRHAEMGDRLAAAKAFRRAFELDPGNTEARFDLARIYELEGRMDDARAVLLEATRRDPTRFDAWMRLGHAEIGLEPIPGDPPPEDVDWVSALKRYNKAHEVAPDRFEYHVALARLERRKARTPEELQAVDTKLNETAGAFAPADAQPWQRLTLAPAELIEEAFRVAEAMGAGDAFPSKVLGLAIRKDPDVGVRMRREVDRFLAEAQRREDEAKERAAKTLDPKVFAAADRAFDAAAVRLAALLEERALDLIEQLTQARAEKELKRYRMSLVRYRGILAATQGPNAADMMDGDPNAGLRWRGELLREAAVVASKVDAALARGYWARAFTLGGMLALNEGDPDKALTVLRRALDYDDGFADTHYQLARVYATRSELDDASKALLRALELGSHWKGPARVEPQFAALRERPEVRRALQQ